MSPITKEEALELIEGSSKYSHSLQVSKIMMFLASIFLEDENEWELVGLLHDLDYDLVHVEMHKHGVVASNMLNGKLSERSLHAIRTHDHRTGVKPKTLLDRSLIFADSLAVLVEDQDLTSMDDESLLHRALQAEDEIKPWIGENIRTYCSKMKISVPQILQML